MQAKLKVGLIVAGLLFFFVVGLSTGVAAVPTPVAAEPTPAPTVTATVTPPPVTKYEYITQEKTPAVCIKALDSAAELLGIQAQIFELIPQMVQASWDKDAAALGTLTKKMEVLHFQQKTAREGMGQAPAECRAKQK